MVKVNSCSSMKLGLNCTLKFGLIGLSVFSLILLDTFDFKSFYQVNNVRSLSRPISCCW